MPITDTVDGRRVLPCAADPVYVMNNGASPIPVVGEKIFIPDPVTAEYALTVTNAGVSTLNAVAATTARVHIRVEGSGRYTMHVAQPPITGLTPGVGFGTSLDNHDILWLNANEAANIQLISNTSTSMYLHVIEYMVP